MKLLFKIAWRNVKRHKGRSLVIGTIIGIGAIILTLGNATISGMNRGIRRGIVEKFTGDILIISSQEEDPAVIFREMGKPVAVLKDYNKVAGVLRGEKEVKDFIPVGRGTVFILNPKGDPTFSIVLGVNYPHYKKMFNNITVIEGRELQDGERGILINKKARELFYKFRGFWVAPEGVPLNPKDFPEGITASELDVRRELILMGFTSDGTSKDIKVPVRGIFKYKFLDLIWQRINLLDIKSFQECFNYSNYISPSALPSSERKLLEINEQDITELFGEENEESAPNAVKNLFSTESKSKNYYNLVFVKLFHHKKRDQIIARLNAIFKKKKIEAKAISWEKAIGPVASMATITKGALDGFVFFIFLVAIIIIINTLTIAVIERATEIATMRAIGAGKGFVARLFFMETFILSFISGSIGVILGIIFMFFLRHAGIAAGDNPFLQILFGGSTYQPYLSLSDLLVIVIELLIVTILAVIYPARLATTITPLEAIARE